MLRVGLRALADGPVETSAVVEPDDPLLDDLDFELGQPLAVRGRLMDSGQGRYFWKGTLECVVEAACRRCLVPVAVRVAADVEVLFTAQDAGDDPATYLIEPGATELVLDDMVREELLLATPDYVLCREDCAGLCPKCGNDLNEGPCSCEGERDPRWEALRVLERREPENER